MKRWSGLVAAAAILALAGPSVAGKKAKKKQALDPVTIQITNQCKSELAIKLGELALRVPAGATTEAQQVSAKDDWSYALWMNGEKPVDLGLVSLQPGGVYVVGLSGCRGGGADVFTQDKAERPKTLSPNAAATYRFRARQKVYLEYKAGKTGRFRALSVAMTRYKEAAGGKMDFTLRLRAAKRGPVLKMFRTGVDLVPGHKYLIEANVFGRDIFYKWEDEGWSKS